MKAIRPQNSCEINVHICAGQKLTQSCHITSHYVTLLQPMDSNVVEARLHTRK